MKNETATIDKLVNMNSGLVVTAMDNQRRTVLLRQAVGYLIDAAEPTDTGEYIVPGESIDDLRGLLSGTPVPARTDDDKYICNKCRSEIDRNEAKRVGLVFYCSGCIREYFGDDDVAGVMQTFTGNNGTSC